MPLREGGIALPQKDGDYDIEGRLSTGILVSITQALFPMP